MVSGIYKILNKFNNKIYIGSAKNLNKRKSSHFNDLLKNRHSNKKLQNSYNKYGAKNFEFIILCNCPKEYLIKLEQWFLDNLKPSYNICKVAGSRLGQKMKPNVKKAINEGRLKVLEKTKKDNSDRRKGISFEQLYGIDKAIKLKEKFKQNRVGKKHSEETKQKISKNNLLAKANNKGKTIEELYGEEKAKSIKLKMSISSQTMKVKKARIETGKKLKGRKQSEEHKSKRADSKSKPIKVTNLLDNSFTIYKGILDFSKISNVSETRVINVLKKDGIMKYKKLKIERL